MKITIIGGGAAGMMAAISATNKNPDAEIEIIEKNKILGRKVIISGGGRCNLTTTVTNIKELMTKYPRGNKWLKYVMHEFSPEDLYNWFEKQGIPLKKESLKVYPVSNKGTDITTMFENLFKKNNIKVTLETEVKKIEKSKNGFKLTLANNQIAETNKVILTTGGNAFAHTGSTGDGYAFARNLGHTITPLKASLTSFISNNELVKTLSGVSIQNAKLKIQGKEKYEFTGDFLFTHLGLTGPGIFALSALSSHEEISDDKPKTLFVDFIPNKNPEQIKEAINYSRTTIAKTFSPYIPKSVFKVLAKRLSINETYPFKDTSKKNINRIIETLKNFSISLTKRTPGHEIVTAGGVSLSEVDQKTMESKITPGLYFAGELLDIDGFTGGYNLQAAWATGKLAGDNAAT